MNPRVPGLKHKISVKRSFKAFERLNFKCFILTAVILSESYHIYYHAVCFLTVHTHQYFIFLNINYFTHS